MRAPLWWLVAWSRWRHPWSLVRDLALLCMAAAAAGYLAAVFPALDYHYTAAFRHARFEAVVVLKGGAGVGAADVREKVPHAGVVAMRTFTGSVRTRSGWEPVDLWVIRRRDLSDLGRTYYSAEALERGTVRPEAVSIGLGTSRGIGTGVGDRVEVSMAPTVPASKVPAMGREVSALWRPMDGLDGIVLPMSDAEFDSLSEGVETHVFIDSRTPLSADEVDALEALAAVGQGAVLSPPAGVVHGRQRLGQVLSHNTAYGTVALALLVYLGFTWRSVSGALRQRERTHAVLLSLGARPGAVALATAADQTVVSAIALAIGGGLAATGMWRVSGLYVPSESIAVLGSVMLLLVGSSGFVSAIAASRRLRSIPVARLLSSQR